MKHHLITLALLVFVPIAMAAPPRAIPGINSKDSYPAGCVDCHVKDRRVSVQLPHGIHFAKGDASEFVKQFQGECTHCHKLNKTTGTWSLPSGAEK